MSSYVTMQPRLDAPGAGLPAVELAWLKIMFRVACRLISKRTGLSWFQHEGNKIIALVRQIPPLRGTIPVLIKRIVGIEDSSRYWSAFMVLDHLRIVDEGITQIVTALTDDRLFGQEVRIQDVKPSPQSGPEAIDRFCDAVANYESTIDQLGMLGRTMLHAHPWFGPMTAHDWHCLAAIHHWVHRRQLERIVKIVLKEA